VGAEGRQHPVLAQIFMNWRLAPDVQFPNAWPIDHGKWSELSEGFLGPQYVSLVPDWFKADYNTYYPTLDQIQSSFKSIDWKAYNDSAKVFQDYYKQKARPVAPQLASAPSSTVRREGAPCHRDGRSS
jgi:hypothetical protein